MSWENHKDPAYNTAAYRRARDACLKRARWRCEIRLDGICTGTASQADHAAGIASDPHHKTLRAACAACHKQVTHQQAAAAKAAKVTDPEPQPRTAW